MKLQMTLVAIVLAGQAQAAEPPQAGIASPQAADAPSVRTATLLAAESQAEPATPPRAPATPALTPAASSAAPSIEATPRSGDWQSNLGAATLTSPRYPGSDEQRYRLVPVFEARWRYVVLDPIRGVGVQFRLTPALTVRGALGLDLTSRRARDDARLAGLDNVDAAGVLRFGADYRLGIVQFTGLASSRLGGRGSRGTTVDGDVALNVLRSPEAGLNVGLTARWIDQAYADTFFNVSPRQSARSGLPIFEAGNGVASTGIFAQALWRFTADWGLAARVSLNQLRGDVAASPIVRDKRQASAVLSVAWAF